MGAVLAALSLLALVPDLAGAATLPSGFTETSIGGLSSPTAMAFAPDGRLFVCQQGGALRVIKNGALLATPFLTVSVNASGERGLLGVAFDPDFASNQFLYVYYTTSTSPIHNRVSRFTANGDVVVTGSELQILNLNDLSTATNHNGGAMHFGPDGKLYIAVGENATSSNSQTLANLLGKVLRINPDPANLVPSDNPFFTTATGNNRAIWALGLRNPFTFSFQNGTGRMFINDVGQNTWEEVNDGIAGSNYGWPTTEGATTNPSFRSPLYTYDHSNGQCAITGGDFYNPATQSFPVQYAGKYFFADYCAGWIQWLDPSLASPSKNDFASGISSPVDIKVSDAGDLWYLARGSSAVFRVRSTTSLAPNITQQPASQTISVGSPVTFTVSATGNPPLAYRWQRNLADIPGATSPSYTLNPTQMSDDGAQFQCVVSNAQGTATSNAAALTVTPNQPPVPTITLPPPGTLYSAGDTINYAGTATDPEDGTLGASAFTWEIVFHHDTHTHPFIAPTSGSMSGSFVVPTTGETSTNVWYRIHLTVQDSMGITGTTFRDINPRTSTVSLATVPAGLKVKLEGQPTTTPYSEGSVVGMVRALDVVAPQKVNGTTWVFGSWSDGGAAAHNVSTPSANTTYTATYKKARAQLTTPAPGTKLAGSTATFGWTAGTGVTGYWLEVGTSPGGKQLWVGSEITTTSTTVTGLPVNGAPIYTRIWSRIGGVWEFDDFTYTAAGTGGGGSSKAVMQTPTPGSTLTGSSATFTWNAGSGATAYWLEVGTAAGAKNLYPGASTTALSATVSGLPTNGSTLYVRLWTRLGGAWQYNDYTYMAAGTGGGSSKAVMQTPTPGSTLTGSTATFTWNAGSGATSYWLEIGTAPGAKNLYPGANTTALSAAVSGLPTNGSTVYVRLWTRLGGVWQYNDYTYTAAGTAGGSGKAMMQTPIPGSTLTGSTTTFTWNAGTGATSYWLEVGTTAGGKDLYPGANTTALSATVSGLPTNGSTLYVRLWTMLNGAWQYNNYTYTSGP